jgi:hypothetical protein
LNPPPIADIQESLRMPLSRILKEHSSTWQSDDDFGELARLGIDLD